ncbi:MAG: cob(I)yrinic acid a,c-diamide adenosyltransferase [Planctomycetales bacterium]|nr:cob(I)yrinic acid a,c-diamide adenosyltransferase [Planctomycetales bacterium]
MKIYTKTGDAGETGLFGGPRVRKHDRRIAAYGEVDELNAALGVARSVARRVEIDSLLERLQNRLFDLGAELATPDPARHGTNLLAMHDIASLEQSIDRLEEQLAPLKTFILPGGGPLAAQLHLARCICRRAERAIVALAEHEPVSETALAFVNRLSDLLFVLARYANRLDGVDDVPWTKSESGE